MLKVVRQTVVIFVLLTILTGILYPLGITAIAKICFPNRAEGSLVDKDGKLTTDEKAAVGSALIGQNFDQPQYFWPRPSATAVTGGADSLPYNAAQSTGSNLGPTNSALTDAIKGRIDVLRKADPSNSSAIPVDLVTASGSGLDPDESVAAAEFQKNRVAAARGTTPEKIEALIMASTEEPTLGLLGERVVNVLALNVALDRQFPVKTAPATGPAAQ
ncbi:MAG TPA: potassium-transporting ATPase subunit KdpC [Phycisphaerae bacterium]|nr:potassium-transporting ATPase subunit KdpC [Phycisphaerae bacterium]